MEVTRKLRAIEKDRDLARLNAIPVRIVQDKFRRFLAQAEREQIDLRAWQKRINSLARALGFPDPEPRRFGFRDECPTNRAQR
jgi:hypothetical protein